MFYGFENNSSFTEVKKLYDDFMFNIKFEDFHEFRQFWKNLNIELLQFQITSKDTNKYEIRDMISQMQLIWNIMNFNDIPNKRRYRKIVISDAYYFMMNNYKLSNKFSKLSSSMMNDIFWLYSMDFCENQ